MGPIPFESPAAFHLPSLDSRVMRAVQKTMVRRRTVFCCGENRAVPEDEFEDQNGSLVHILRVSRPHFASNGMPVGPERIPGGFDINSAADDDDM
jgi:hypothetical protein